MLKRKTASKNKIHEVRLENEPALLDEIISTLQDGQYTRTMASELLRDVLQSGTYLEVPEGVSVIKEGDKDDDVYFLLEGQMDVRSDGKLILSLDAPGDIIGEFAVVSSAPRSADVSAERPSRLVRVSSTIVKDPEGDPQRANQFLNAFTHIMAAKLRETSLRAKLYEDAMMEAEAFASSAHRLEGEVQDKLQQVKLYSRVIELTNDAVLITDTDGIVQQHNPAASGVFAPSGEDIHGKSVEKLLKEFNLGEFSGVPKNTPWRGEWTLGKAPKGLVFQATVSPITGRDHKPIAVAYQLRDISLERAQEHDIARKNEEIRTTLQELESTFEELQHSDRLKMESLTVISNELASPIRKILNHATKLIDSLSRPLKPELINQVNQIQDQAIFLKAISENINQLIDMESEVATVSGAELDIAEVTRQIVRELEPKAKRKMVTLEVKMPAEPLKLSGDPERFTVMLNLLLEQALMVAHIRTKLEITGQLLEKMSQVHLDVRYTGPLLTNTPNTAKLQSKMNLLIGLPLARRVISQYHGSLQFLKDGAQSRIAILLPLAQKEGEERPNRVMIADEREMDRMIVRGVIEHQYPGSVILESEEPFEFLDNYEDFRPDLVVIDPDFAEPGWTNHRIIAALVQDRRHSCPVLAVSGLYQDFAERTIAIERGVTDFLAKPYSIFDIQFKVNSMIQSHRKVETLHETMDQAQRQAFTDGLTRIANRKNFDGFLETQINYSRQTKKPCSLIMIDVDNFKHYNDTNGHQMGDEVLKGFAQILTKSVRSSDLPARYGGEEFVIVLPETKKDMAVVIAEKVRRALMEFDFPNGKNQPLGFVSASFGVSTFDEDANTGEGLLKAADDCLYLAKDMGRNVVVQAPASAHQKAAG